ncbi:hypothetical protein NPIL_95981 [Nephila pilipes]|uniref:Uncharacterized protein n=1 Tax=Nephila pilipes TaxID=299642 RepID=A0A8X6NB38_NEPPI|nr:hypothetical protein NPIL_95981 [Nephila pilipes]
MGHAIMTTFCGIMDFPLPIAEKSYNNAVDTLRKYTKEIVETSMQRVALEEVTLTHSSDIIIRGNRTSKSLGYSFRVRLYAVTGD